MDNLIVAALWFGPNKPNMKTLLQPIVENIASISNNGIRIPGSAVCIRAKLVMAVFDLPARAAATNTKQFNGEYGCTYCLDKGRIVNRAHIYPPDDNHKLRESKQMKEWAVKAEMLNVSVYGIKGTSVLSDVLEIPVCIPIDYMHSLFEGVFKQLMKLWFGSSYHSEPYSLRRHIKTIDKLVSKVKPPNEIQRLPHSINNLSFFKASEYRAWVLYYAFPIVSVFLPTEYSQHLVLLISAIHILLSDHIKKSNLQIAHKMLSTFYREAGNIYSSNIYTAYMHSLEHMAGIVDIWGPMWAYSLFGFENLNGYLSCTFHGTRKILLRMSFNIQLTQSLPVKLHQLSQFESSETKAYIENLLSTKSNTMHIVEDDCYIIGKTSLQSLTSDEMQLITQNGFSLSSHEVQCFDRILKSGLVYCSNKYLRSKTRINTYCSFILPSGGTGYGEIRKFFSLQQAQPTLSIIRILHQKDETSPICALSPSLTQSINDIQCLDKLKNQIVHVVSTQELVVVPLKNITNKCVKIKVPIVGQKAMYVIPFPNKFEVH
uniref:Uncharacterized protein n=1 Tax=Amphimedon queenslandica TaxID=400682 RepID=A0A1X7UEC1_AMPQE